MDETMLKTIINYGNDNDNDKEKKKKKCCK